MRIVLAAAAAAVLFGSAACADGKVTISRGVADDFKAYQASIGSVGMGVYAITEDGQGGAGNGCSQGNCSRNLADAAIERCEKLNPGRKCVIFARNQDPVVEFEIGQ